MMYTATLTATRMRTRPLNANDQPKLEGVERYTEDHDLGDADTNDPVLVTLVYVAGAA